MERNVPFKAYIVDTEEVMTVYYTGSTGHDMVDIYKDEYGNSYRICYEKIQNANTEVMVGAALNNDMFILGGFEKVVVDIEDVFAVGYVKSGDFRYQVNGHEVVWCVVFTNDPYIPVFPMLFVLKKGLMDLTKSKKGREVLKDGSL